MVWEIDNRQPPIPEAVSKMFRLGPDDTRGTLKVDLHGIWLHAHFFAIEEIEFDIDPREIHDEVSFTYLVNFMRDLAGHLGKPVFLCPENTQELAFLTVPPSGAPIYHPARS